MGLDIEFTPEGNAMFIMINNNHSKQNAARHGIQTTKTIFINLD